MAYKGIATYQYDSNGSLLSETTTQLDYATGQILSTDPATGLPIQPQVKSYTYNAFKQNISVTNADGSFQQNIYDALGLRISTIENGYRSDYIFDRGSVIAELDGSGTLTSMNIRGHGLLAQKDEKGRLNYYQHNAHGDVTSLIDASGKVLNSYQYDAFGNTMTYAETVANRFQYAGEQLDPITGQYYLRARYYDPQVGRFTQEDTYNDGLKRIFGRLGVMFITVVIIVSPISYYLGNLEYVIYTQNSNFIVVVNSVNILFKTLYNTFLVLYISITIFQATQKEIEVRSS